VHVGGVASIVERAEAPNSNGVVLHCDSRLRSRAWQKYARMGSCALCSAAARSAAYIPLCTL
jgi:hypothetical protein